MARRTTPPATPTATHLPGHHVSMTVAEAKNRFSDLLRRAEYAGERIIIERHGKPVAAIVSTGDLRQLERAEDGVDVRDAGAALAEAKEQGTIPLEVVLRKHGLAHLLVQGAPPRSRRSEEKQQRSKRTRAAAQKRR